MFGRPRESLHELIRSLQEDSKRFWEEREHFWEERERYWEKRDEEFRAHQADLRREDEAREAKARDLVEETKEFNREILLRNEKVYKAVIAEMEEGREQIRANTQAVLRMLDRFDGPGEAAA